MLDTSKYKLCSNLRLYNIYCKVIEQTLQLRIRAQRSVLQPAVRLESADKTQLKPMFTAYSKVFISKISVKHFPSTQNKYSIIKKIHKCSKLPEQDVLRT